MSEKRAESNDVLVKQADEWMAYFKPAEKNAAYLIIRDLKDALLRERRDGGRYRWLRENCLKAESWYDEEGIDAFHLEFKESHCADSAPQGLDSAIDAAIAQQGSKT